MNEGDNTDTCIKQGRNDILKNEEQGSWAIILKVDQPNLISLESMVSKVKDQILIFFLN